MSCRYVYVYLGSPWDFVPGILCFYLYALRSWRSQSVRLHGRAIYSLQMRLWTCPDKCSRFRIPWCSHGHMHATPHMFFLMHTHRGLCACRTSVCARAARIRGHAYVHLSFLLSRLCVHACCDIVLLLCHHQLLDTVCVQNQWIQGACLVCLDVCFHVHNRGRILISL